jgi:hypothetical protein
MGKNNMRKQMNNSKEINIPDSSTMYVELNAIYD